MARWARGEQAVQYLVGQNRLESFKAEDLAALAEALVARAELRVETTATAALAGGDVDGAYVAAYDAYRMAAEALLARQALRATGGDGRTWPLRMPCRLSSARKSRYSRSRRSSGSGGLAIQRSTLIPPAAPLTASDATWAIEKAKKALSGVRALLAPSPPEPFS